MNFRHEMKHEITYSDMLALRARLSAVMQSDPHARNGSYEIRSLYFDNVYDKALREKVDGVNNREKFRIRLYNGDSSHILLEKKSKINGLCSKQQMKLTYEQAEAFANGDHPITENTTAQTGSSVLTDLIAKMDSEGLRPSTIVDYKRDPFIYAPGNVRVTIDYDLRTGMKCTDFLNPDCVTVPVPDSPAILEVKWDEYLPSIIRDIVQIPSTHTSSFSKYAACRIYG